MFLFTFPSSIDTIDYNENLWENQKERLLRAKLPVLIRGFPVVSLGDVIPEGDDMMLNVRCSRFPLVFGSSAVAPLRSNLDEDQRAVRRNLTAVQFGSSEEFPYQLFSGSLAAGQYSGALHLGGPRGHSDAMGTLWISTRGTMAHTHYDQSDNLYVQLEGRKRWRLYPPIARFVTYPSQHEYYHQTQNSDSGRVHSEVVLQPGEVLFIPAFWYHSTSSVTKSVSVSVLTPSHAEAICAEAKLNTVRFYSDMTALSKVVISRIAIGQLPGLPLARRRYLMLTELLEVGRKDVFRTDSCWSTQRDAMEVRLRSEVLGGMQPSLQLLKQLQPGIRQICGADIIEDLIVRAFGHQQIAHFLRSECLFT